MLKNSLSSWNKKRLRFILIIFFFVLAIPTAILIKQSYSQLKWEAFHHYRLQAEELSTRIDLRYKELIERESARTFTDYSFLNIAGDIQDKVLQRSPLSTFPVASEFPGIIGYFQIDNNGQFTTPLLPSFEQRSQRQNYDIAANEKFNRQKVHDQIYKILNQNKLVSKPAIKVIEEERTVSADKESSDNIQFKSSAIELDDAITSKSMAPERVQENIAPQAAFDKLQTQQAYSPSLEANIYSKNRGRVEDLKLKRKYQEKSLKQKKSEKTLVLKKERKKLSLRRESNVLPAPISLIKENEIQAIKKDKQLHINMFESEINAFEFSLLQSGHFVLYRKVWRNGLRYIQGFLINQDIFINNVIGKDFYKTNVSKASNLTIAYQGNILSTLNSNISRQSYSSRLKSQGNNELQGTLLLQNRLSETLDQVELIFSIDNLPAGPGGTIISWLSIILLLILCGGFFILYILGLKQIKLARQQQDFVSAVSHELKTPLTSIRMYGEMLREGWTTEDKRKQYYDYIYDESERLTRLINNVLQLARMTRNELPVDLKPYSVAELIDTVRSKISSQVERAEFKLNLSCDEDISDKTLLVDADYFVQIIINLVDNAIKFSSKSEKQQIDISCQLLRNDKIQFSIRDYGPGINKDQMRKIFQLFYRTENELTRETVGTGIGLSLVQQLVSSMHGKIDIINQEPGTEFQITFKTI